MQYITVKQASERWGISDRRVRVLCSEGRIEGVIQKGRSYLIPVDTLKPIDGRSLRGQEDSGTICPRSLHPLTR